MSTLTAGVTLSRIVRHPIKSVGHEELDSATLSPGRALPWDRAWAIKTAGAPFDGAPAGWVPKQAFVRGVAAGSLQAIRADFDDGSGRVTLFHPDLMPFTGILPDCGPALIDWLRPLWPDTRPAPQALVARSDGGALTDVPDPWVAILSTTSNRILGARMGMDLSIHRWRGNLWLDGLAPWEEFDLVGRDIRIGPATLRVEARITRCAATTFDPATGHQRGDTLAALESGWDHTDFGVYARVIRGGQIAPGDKVSLA